MLKVRVLPGILYYGKPLSERVVEGISTGVNPRVSTFRLYSNNRSAILERLNGYTQMQKQHFPKVHTWGIVGAYFLHNYAPRNHQLISKIS